MFFKKSRSEKYYWKGDEKYELKDYKGAIKDYSKAIKLNPQNKYAFIKRGNSYEYAENYKGALHDYSKVIDLNPKDPYAYKRRGLVKDKLDDLEGTINDFSEAAELFYLKGIKKINKKKIKSNDYEDALGNFNEAIKLNPLNEEFYYAIPYRIRRFLKFYKNPIKEYSIGNDLKSNNEKFFCSSLANLCFIIPIKFNIPLEFTG